MIKYKKNYLTSVVVKLDFLPELPDWKTIPPDFKDKIIQYFPIEEILCLRGMQFTIPKSITEKACTEELAERYLWNYHDKNREGVFSIRPDSILIELKKYESFQSLNSRFMDIFNIFSKVHNTMEIKRIGVRYINEIDIDATTPLELSGFIKPNLLSFTDVGTDKSKIIRGMNLLITKDEDETTIIFRYGIHNPDYPSYPKKRTFILDFDVFKIGKHEIINVESTISKYKDRVVQMFENSIEDGLRRLMNE